MACSQVRSLQGRCGSSRRPLSFDLRDCHTAQRNGVSAFRYGDAFAQLLAHAWVGLRGRARSGTRRALHRRSRAAAPIHRTLPTRRPGSALRRRAPILARWSSSARSSSDAALPAARTNCARETQGGSLHRFPEGESYWTPLAVHTRGDRWSDSHSNRAGQPHRLHRGDALRWSQIGRPCAPDRLKSLSLRARIQANDGAIPASVSRSPSRGTRERPSRSHGTQHSRHCFVLGICVAIASWSRRQEARRHDPSCAET